MPVSAPARHEVYVSRVYIFSEISPSQTFSFRHKKIKFHRNESFYVKKSAKQKYDRRIICLRRGQGSGPDLGTSSFSKNNYREPVFHLSLVSNNNYQTNRAILIKKTLGLLYDLINSREMNV